MISRGVLLTSRVSQLACYVYVVFHSFLVVDACIIFMSERHKKNLVCLIMIIICQYP